ncbi:sigma-E factor negative regulatory protein RseA [Oceanospirillum multiglobuliferum]|uniref:Anti sigma-E protein RseA N-terminal domain-containing protein n=1 Tax=Oceanospirillum multiglobuliferum TaxID=64969 RepID=A0A1T4KM38_9GAMM|nr:sigma-E factor negative regulatory protein [Oceanospirillum multiglobuliferum]OPX56070.1 hypothetical protein BTE48_05855 [Oceanospirillum multiglobuliferum]SJZ43502.1 sigma-E factor negative regulatory protein RseA [Oceanospirillum multiglobuliferum]
MSDDIHQSLSNLMDSEADELELRRVLKASQEQAEVAQTWHRYHLIRSVLHKELEQPQLFDISDRISAAIDLEDEIVLAPEQPVVQPTVSDKTKTLSFWREAGNGWLGKTAIAASVAAAVVLLMPQPSIDQPMLAKQSAAPVYQNELPRQSRVAPSSGVQLVSAGAEQANAYHLVDSQKQRQEQLIRAYLMQHSEYVSATGTHGMMPMVRVAGYQAVGQ